MSTLQHKFDSPVFKEQWEQVKGKINTKHRGKRRTLVQRLVAFFNRLTYVDLVAFLVVKHFQIPLTLSILL